MTNHGNLARYPTNAPASPDTVRSLASLTRGRRTLVQSGAGISTESGIPDYRGRGALCATAYPCSTASSWESRQRYWARSFVGWAWVSGAALNEVHRALARLERARAVVAVITQNIDNPHNIARSGTQ